MSIKVDFGNCGAFLDHDLGFSDTSAPWFSPVTITGEPEATPPFEDFSVAFERLQAWRRLGISAHSRSHALQVLADFPKCDVGLWAEAAKATLRGRMYNHDRPILHVNHLPPEADTMSGWARLTNVQQILARVVEQGVQGDFLEAGVWRGGVCIFARALLDMMGELQRTVWVVDSFRGLPPPTIQQDFQVEVASPVHWSDNFLASLQVSRKEVQGRFKDWGLTRGVRFVQGYFNKSIPRHVPRSTRLAVLRADGDLYESTMDILFHCYGLLVVGGFFICDCCGDVEVARRAIVDFRRWHGIQEPITNSDGGAWWWQKKLAVTLQMNRWDAIEEERRSQKFEVRRELIQAISRVRNAMEGTHFHHRFDFFWQFSEIRPLLLAVLHEVSLLHGFQRPSANDQVALALPKTTIDVGIELMMRVHNLLWTAHGDTRSLLLVDLALARLLHASGRIHEAWDTMEAASGMFGNMKDDWTESRAQRIQAFEEVDHAMALGELGLSKREQQYWSNGCLAALRSPQSFRDAVELGFGPYSKELAFGNDSTWVKHKRKICHAAGHHFALLHLNMSSYGEQDLSNEARDVVNQLLESDGHFRTPEGALLPSLRSSSVCLPTACVLDEWGLAQAIWALIGYVYFGRKLFNMPVLRWQDDVKIVIDPAAMPDWYFTW